MNDLILSNDAEQRVSARALHEQLNIEKRFSAWFETNSQGFIEGEDFIGAYLKVQSNQYGGEKEIQDYQLSLDMAKHICLMSRTPEGKKVRQYLIDLEKAWNTPELIMARALKVANCQIEALTKANDVLIQDVERMKPKEIFADAVATSKSSILVGELAKLIKQNGIDIGQNRLFAWLREHGYLLSSNIPSQKSMDLKLFEVLERTVNNPDGSIRTTQTTKVTGKGQQYFINKFLGREG